MLKLLLSVHHHHSGVSEKSYETSAFGGKPGVANTVCATQGPLQEVDTARETSFSHYHFSRVYEVDTQRHKGRGRFDHSAPVCLRLVFYVVIIITFVFCARLSAGERHVWHFGAY